MRMKMAVYEGITVGRKVVQVLRGDTPLLQLGGCGGVDSESIRPKETVHMANILSRGQDRVDVFQHENPGIGDGVSLCQAAQGYDQGGQ